MATTGLDAVLNEIETIKQNVQLSYDAVEALGGEVPTGRALRQLPTSIATLGVSPIGRIQGAGVLHITLTTSKGTHALTDAQKTALLDGAKVIVYTPNAVYQQEIMSLDDGTNFAVNVIPSPSIPKARVKIVLGELDASDPDTPIIAFPTKYVNLAAGETVSLPMALDWYESDAGEAFWEIGRVQRLDSTASSSYLIVRKYNSSGAFVEEKFGWFRDEAQNEPTFPTNWHNDTGINTFIPEIEYDSETEKWVQTNTNPDPTGLYWERDIFPYNQAKRVRMHSAIPIGSGKTASADLYFTEVPIYYVKNEVRTLTFDTKNNLGEVTSTASAECRIWWLSKVQLPGYELPSWEKKWIYEEEGEYDGEQHNYSHTSVAKAANYYACYKNVTKSYDSGNVIQSYPYGSTVSGNSRGDMCTLSKVLNNYSMTIYGSGVFTDGTTFEADTTNRRFNGNTWLEFQAFRYLMYIQFGTDIQATLLGITKNNNSGDTTIHYQNACEGAMTDNPSIKTFSLGDAHSSHPIVWLGILNPHGSEGDQMADATTFAERIADGTQTTMLAILDRALMTPHATNKATMLADGYTQLSYKWTAVGKSGTHKRGLDTNPDFWAYQFPAHNDETAAIELGSSNQVDSQWLSGHPSAGTLGEVARMCSLSNGGGYARALGPWYVHSDNVPSTAYAFHWGARVSCVLSAGEGNAAASET